MPWVPLCHLTKLEKARQVSWDEKRLAPLSNTFLLKGYYEPKGSFICLIEAPGYPLVEVTSEITEKWDDIWRQINDEFETEIYNTCWKDLSEKNALHMGWKSSPCFLDGRTREM